MLRKPRITSVPVESLPEGSQTKGQQDLTPATEEQGKTDAEQMTEILQEVKEEHKEAVSDAPVVVKPKAKRASRAKPKEEPKEEPILTLQVSDQREEEPKEEPKGDDKVGCSDCGKQMSAKTLKYSHGPNCSSKKPKTKTDTKEGLQPTIQREEITEELIEHHIRTRTRADRALRRETMMNKLMQTAFCFSEPFLYTYRWSTQSTCP